MAAVTIDLPEKLAVELDNRDVSEEQLQRLLVQAIEGWLDSETKTGPRPEQTTSPPLSAGENNLPAMAELWAELNKLNEQYPIDSDVLRYADSDNVIRVGQTGSGLIRSFMPLIVAIPQKRLLAGTLPSI